MKLYELTETYQALLNLDLDNDDMATALESLQGTIEEKAEGTLMVIKTLEAEQDAYTKEITRLKELKDKASNKASNLKEYLSFNLQQMDILKLDTPLFKLSFRKSTVLKFDDTTLIPAIYKESVTTEKIDKSAIKKAFKNEDVPGCHIEVNQNLQIK